MMPRVTLRLEDYIRSTPDFPEPGILFRDFSPLLMDAAALNDAIERLGTLAAGLSPDFIIVAPEARGFVFGPAMAREAGAGFLPARKPGKLPPELLTTRTTSSTAAPTPDHPFDQLAGARVVVHDDLLATGGTIDAVAQLATRAGAQVVGAVFLDRTRESRGQVEAC